MRSSILYCVTSYHYQIVCLLLFFIGLVGVILSRNLIKVLIGIEFIVNSVNLLFITFATYKTNISYTGYTIGIFVSVISALVMAVGLFFIYQINLRYGTVNIEKIYERRGEKW